jgi:ATP-binding cassette, subfamily B, bacterial CvaB/MchF/RaxB
MRDTLFRQEAVDFVYSPMLAAIDCAAALHYALLRVVLYRPLMQAQNEQIAHAAKQQSSFLETVRGIQSVKLFNRQALRAAAHQNLLVDNFNAGIRVQRLTILYHALNGALFGVENIAVVSLGALAVLDGGFSVGMLAGSRAPCRTVDLDDGRSRDRGRTGRRGFALNFNSSSTDEAFTSIP